jgi:hypothetical protein
LRHLPSGLIVIAEESRSQHENRERGLRRLRQALYLQVREELNAADLTPDLVAQFEDYCDARSRAGRLDLGRKDVRFWPAAGVVLDVLQAVEARVGEAAKLLGLSTGNLIDFLETSPKLWQQANEMRSRFGHKPLR